MQTGSISVVDSSEVLPSEAIVNSPSPFQAQAKASLAQIVAGINQLDREGLALDESIWTAVRRRIWVEFEKGRQLTHLKLSLPHGEFGKLFSNADRLTSKATRNGGCIAFEFTSRSGQRAMKFWEAALERAKALECEFWDALSNPAAELPEGAEADLLGKLPGHTLRQCQMDLGLIPQSKQEIHGTNNPAGKNGGEKKRSASQQENVENLRALARTEIFGHDSKEHRPRFGSPAYWLNSLVDKQGKVGTDASPASHLTKPERSQIYKNLLKPALEAWLALGD
jgi:hypothetical protein